MASVKGWSTIANVKLALGASQGGGGLSINLTDANVESFINMAEGYSPVQMKAPSSYVFSTANSKDWLLHTAVTLLAAKLLLSSTPFSLNTL